MKEFTTYSPDTGEVFMTGACDDDQYEAQAFGFLEIIDQQVDGGTHYIVAGEPVPRPALPEPVGKRWEGLPAGCEIEVDYEPRGTNPETFFELQFSGPGEKHVVTIRPPFPYITNEWELSNP